MIRAGKRVLVIGPTWSGSVRPAHGERVNAEIRTAAEETRVPALDALDPPWLTPS